MGNVANEERSAHKRPGVEHCEGPHHAIVPKCFSCDPRRCSRCVRRQFRDGVPWLLGVVDACRGLVWGARGIEIRFLSIWNLTGGRGKAMLAP